MSVLETKHKIENALKSFSQGDLAVNSLNLFHELGYDTERQSRLPSPTFVAFQDTYLLNDTRFNDAKAKVTDWQYIDLLFQLSKEEILKQTSSFDTKRVNNTIIETYLFFSIELRSTNYTRGELSSITREINQLFPMPVMVLFKYGQLLTLSVINRRVNKKDQDKDVLEKVTQIKDINFFNPNRAHIEILFDLSFYELKDKFHFTNFVELHIAWQKTLDLNLLNKRFFNDLANWYFWSQQYVTFPNDKNLEQSKNIQINLIRLITRLIFVWFLKEKKLVNDQIFDKESIKNILKKFDSEGDQTYDYYNAVLQNLFFGTLNQKQLDRGFVKETSTRGLGVNNLYKHSELFKINEDEIISLFSEIPFLNGGLFDCLDKDNDETKRYEFVDGFTSLPGKTAIVPDMLFFGEKRLLDLTSSYGFKKNKERCCGLFEIFSNYKFTIEENTPLEEEVALDPELLGKVFENLLAYYTPETETTARKQTGSFYTPREIVNYMVDESLIAYLKSALLNEKSDYLQLGDLQVEVFGNNYRKGQLKNETSPVNNKWVTKENELDELLSKLVSYSETENPFLDESDIQGIIYAIDNCKILDPACGSGAFPMGFLQKLVHVLTKLDQENQRWRELRKRKAIVETQKAYDEGDLNVRNQKLQEISETFEENASDYGRKLYLIENCIYGVDIQPIAVQITKLRFFISLVVDQKESLGSPNRGIRPLPNLETKFVAANTLVGLDRPKQLLIGYELIEPLQDQLQIVRHRYFEAKSRKDKLACQKEDKALRTQISEKLESLGMPNSDAKKIAKFDLYDQNTSSNWYEPEWMFGRDLIKGFDIVIANPPYIFTRDADFTEEFKNYIGKKYFSALTGTGKNTKASQSGKINLFALFILRGLFDCKENGILIYIVPNNLLRTTTYDLIRKYLLENSRIDEIVDLGSGIFDQVTASTIVFRVSKNKLNHVHKTKVLTNIENIEKGVYAVSYIEQARFLKNVSYTLNLFADDITEILLKKISDNRTYLGKFCIDIIEGIVAHKHLINDVEGPNTFPIVEGKTIKKYGLNPVKKFITWNVDEIHRTRPNYLWNAPKKIIIQRISGGTNPLTATIDKDHYKTFASVNNLLLKPEFNSYYELVVALLNSKLLNWFYANSFSNNSELTVNISKTYLEKLPIIDFKNPGTEYFTKLVTYIIDNKIQNNLAVALFFERLVDALIYELYLPEIVHSANCNFIEGLKNVTQLNLPVTGNTLEESNDVYCLLSNPAHSISSSLLKLLNITEIITTEGLK